MKKPDPNQEELALAAVQAHKLFPGRTTLYVHEVAAALSIAQNQVINLIEGGKITAINIGNGARNKRYWRIPVSAFDAFIQAENSFTV